MKKVDDKKIVARTYTTIHYNRLGNEWDNDFFGFFSKKLLAFSKQSRQGDMFFTKLQGNFVTYGDLTNVGILSCNSKMKI